MTLGAFRYALKPISIATLTYVELYEPVVKSNVPIFLSQISTERHDGWIRLGPLAPLTIGGLAPLSYQGRYHSRGLRYP